LEAPAGPPNAPAPHGRSALWALGLSNERLIVAAILTITIWLVHFSQSLHFGLYEEDWFFIGQPMLWSWGKLIEHIQNCFRIWPQARPIGFAVVGIAAFLGNRIGGLEGIYLITFALHVANTLLLYTIVRRHLSTAPSFCAALGYCLFPSSTVTPLLQAQLFNGLTVFFLLFATWLYLRGSRIMAYVVSVGSLLTYESAFLPFFAVPLLHVGSLPNLRRALLKHWTILLAIGASLFWFRAQMGEDKSSAVLDNGWWATLERIGTAMYAGSVTTLRLFVMRLVTVWRDGDREVLLIVIVLAAGFTLALYLMRVHLSDELELWSLSVTSKRYRLHANLSIDHATATALRLGTCGLFMLVIAYGLAISKWYYPPVVEVGRLTTTHISAAVGSALLCGAISAILLDLGVSHRKKFWAALALACYFSGLGGFHYLVQEDFRKSWVIQRSFWASVKKQCPDLTDGTVLIYEIESYATPYIASTGWADFYILGEVYDFPKNWKDPPKLISTTKAWMADVTSSDGQFVWQPFANIRTTLLQGNVILLRGVPGDLKRVSGTITLKAKEFALKSPAGPSAVAFRPGPMYRYVMQP
jgi:hypothetical protein